MSGRARESRLLARPEPPALAVVEQRPGLGPSDPRGSVRIISFVRRRDK